MVSIPVLDENLDFERLDLHRHYVVIDCDFTVYLILNPIGEKPLSGTDIAVINIGSWQLDAWKFLVKDNFPNEAGFSAVLAWDKTLVQDTEQGRKRPRIAESDVDIANSVSSLKGQPVNITGFSLDDGKSLKVSTLENEFCFVRPFPSSELITSDVVNVGSAIFNIKVDDLIDVDNFLSYFRKKCLCEVIDDSIHLKVMNFSYHSLSDASYKNYVTVNCGIGCICYSVQGSLGSGTRVGVANGAVIDCADVIISVADGVVSSISVSFIGVQTATMNNNSNIVVTQPISINEQISSITLW